MKTPTANDRQYDLCLSLLRDFFAAMATAGIHASVQDGYPESATVAIKAYEQADDLLKLSKTPKLLEQLKTYE